MRKKQLNVFLTTILMVASMSVYAQDGVGYVPLTALDGMLSYGQYDQSHQEAYDKLVDANEQTRWGGWFNPALSDENSWPQNSEESANKMYIIVKTKDGEAVVPTSYFLVTGYDTGSYPGRNWASWKIYGGNFDSDEFAVREDEGWTLIDEREDEPLPAENYGTKDLNFNRADGTTAYKYYWIEIAKTVANSDIYIQMSEWGLGSYETFEQYLDRPTSVVDEPVNYKFLSGSSGYAGEGAENLLDGNTATKWMYQFTNREKGQTSNGAYIVFRASRAMTPSYYTLSTANDTESHPGRWKQWQIYGMNADNDESVTRDSEGWVLLDDKANVPTGNGINELPAANYASSFFTLSETNTEEYRYFKIEVDKIVSGGYMQMSEFALGDEYTCAFENIIFADANVKSICVNNWDTNGDGELSYGEAATVTSIGEVFKGNTSITIFDELQYFKGLISIGESAFQGCSSLTSIILPDGITTIGDDMFIDCSSLTSIIIPNGVTSIGYSAFDFCSNLTAITIPESVTIIGDYAFYGCDAINSVIVGMQTPIDLSMNSSTFGNYSNATLYVPTGSKAAYQSADVWKDFKEIMEYNYVDGSQDPPVSEFNAALAAITDGSYYLTTDVNGTKYYVTQNGHLTNDEESAYVFAISKVNASGAVSPLFDVAFLIDPGNGVHFSNPTPLLDGKAYLHLGFFYQDDHNNRNDWDRQVLFLNETGKFAIRSSNTPYDENSWLDAGRTFWTWEVGTDNSIIPCYSYEPAYIWTLEEAGAKEGFWTDANGTEWYFTISGSKATISNRGWDNSGHIPSISGTIPNELTIPSTVYIGETPYLVNAIGDCAFYNCSCLTSITIPEEVTSIGWSAFYGCSSLTSITIPESVTSIARGAFFYCSGLTSITIPKSVTFIKGDLFTGCDNLTSITVEEGNSVYDSRNGCNAIIKTASNILISGCRNTIIPESVVSIGESAFQSRYILTSITIPDGVASIGDYAFNCCADLTSITIPNSVKTIGSGAFRICDNLTSIVVNEGNTVYDSRNGCNAIIESASNTLISGCKNTIIPDGVTSIGSEAFYCCYSLTSINIPESVTSIGESSFVGCISLSSITIPESVTVIGERSFAGCSKLNTVTVNAVTPPACADDAFSNIADNCTLKVPYGTGDAYAAADGWKNFNEIIECDPEGTDISQLDNAIYIEPFVAKVGENAQMVICLKNAEAATAYVFDLVLPEGITVAKNDKGKYIDELSDRHDDHTRTFNYKGNNTYSLSTLSGNSEQLTGNDGPIRLVTIEASDNMVEGNYAIEIKNASYSKPDGTLVSLPDTRAVVTVEDYVLGDVNGNGGVDIGDAVSIVNYLVGKDSSIFVAKAADTNKNGQIDIGDAVTIVNLLVGKITNFTREFNIIWDEKEPE